MKDIIPHDPDFKPTGRNRTVQGILDQIDKVTYDSRIKNEERRMVKYDANSIISLSCALCQSPLKKIKPRIIEGLGTSSIAIPTWRCSVCHVHYEGWSQELRCTDNHNILAIVNVWNPY